MNEKSENSKVPVSNYGSLPLLKTDRNPDDFSRLKHSYNIDRRLLTVRSVTVTSDDRYLIITFGNSPKIRVVDMQKLEYVPHKFDAHWDTVRLISPCNNNTFYTASWDGQFMQFNILTGEGKLLFCSSRSPSVFLDPEQKYLFVAEYPDFDVENRNCGRCWDLQNKRTIAIYKHRKDRIAPESIDIA
jgi:WD40 repeat protein